MSLWDRLKHLIGCPVDTYRIAWPCGCADEWCATCKVKTLTQRCEDHGCHAEKIGHRL